MRLVGFSSENPHEQVVQTFGVHHGPPEYCTNDRTIESCNVEKKPAAGQRHDGMNMKLKQRCSCLRIASNGCNGLYTKQRGITKRFVAPRDCLTNTWTLLEYAKKKKKHHSCHIGATCPVAQLLKKCLHRCRIWSSIFQLVKGTAVVLNADGQKTATRGCCHGIKDDEKSHVFDSTKWLTSLMSSALVVVFLFFSFLGRKKMETNGNSQPTNGNDPST